MRQMRRAQPDDHELPARNDHDVLAEMTAAVECIGRRALHSPGSEARLWRVHRVNPESRTVPGAQRLCRCSANPFLPQDTTTIDDPTIQIEKAESSPVPRRGV